MNLPFFFVLLFLFSFLIGTFSVLNFFGPFVPGLGGPPIHKGPGTFKVGVVWGGGGMGTGGWKGWVGRCVCVCV